MAMGALGYLRGESGSSPFRRKLRSESVGSPTLFIGFESAKPGDESVFRPDYKWRSLRPHCRAKPTVAPFSRLLERPDARRSRRIQHLSFLPVYGREAFL